MPFIDRAFEVDEVITAGGEPASPKGVKEECARAEQLLAVDTLQAASDVLRWMDTLESALMVVRPGDITANDIGREVRLYITKCLQKGEPMKVYDYILVEGYVYAKLATLRKPDEYTWMLVEDCKLYDHLHVRLTTDKDPQMPQKIFWCHMGALLGGLSHPATEYYARLDPAALKWLLGESVEMNRVTALKNIHVLIADMLDVAYGFYDAMDIDDDGTADMIVWRYFEHRLRYVGIAHPQPLLARLFAGVDEATADAMKKWLYDTVSRVMYVPPLDEWWASWGAALVGEGRAAESSSKRVHA